MTTATRTMAALSASVGHQGANRPDDVRAVQKLLNHAGARLTEDGQCGRATISAIRDYQTNWTRNADGRVDPGGRAWRRLVEGKLKIKRTGYVLLPQSGEVGYYRYSPADQQYGTQATVRSLLSVCKQFNRTYPEFLVGIGDMSFVTGAEMKPHKTHRNGRNIDIRPVRGDGKRAGVAITHKAYSREHTKALVALLKADPNVRSVLFNDSSIDGVTAWPGHDNHLHVSMKE